MIFVSDLYGAAQSVIDPATEAIQIIGRFRGGVNSVTHIASIRPELECMSSSEIDHWIQGASTIFNGWKAQLARTTNIGERTLLQEAIGENSYLPYLDENGKPDSFLIANFYEKEQVKRFVYLCRSAMQRLRADRIFCLLARRTPDAGFR